MGNTEPDYAPVIEKLLETTKAGKLKWQRTADESTFLAAVKGIQTFELRLCSSDEVEQVYPLLRAIMAGPENRIDQSPPVVILTSHGRDGEQLFQIVERNPQSPAFYLFWLVKRTVERWDERIEATVELLNTL